MKLLYGRRLRELAQGIEQEFYRIERESKWRSSLVNGLIAGGAVGLVAWLMAVVEENHLRVGRGDLLLFACLGSSSASVVFAPIQKTNSLRSIVLAYLAASLVCVALYPVRDQWWFPVPLQCGAAVCLSVVLMRLVDAMHPAAVGSAMAFVIYQRDVRSLYVLFLAVVGLIAIVKVLAYVYREELTFKHFPREFRRSYYGAELRVMLPDRRAADAGGPTVVAEPHGPAPGT
jgi:CBS-domain-containing membrane protein